MALKNIITVPDPLLKSVSKPVNQITGEIKKLLNDMLETMYKAPGIGLAAVQVGVPLRAVVIDISRDEEKNPLLFINPKITWRSEETSIYEEGCLSIPNQFAEIERPASCKVEFLDLEDKKKEIKASGLLSTCLQHEVDHLNGILFVDYLSKLKKNYIIKKVSKQKKNSEKIVV
ncbi:MAG: peptide deformylase [Candidatus Pelagibacter sp.]|nr:peptide deformylase [Candidatus Pelagibacter sp.]|tara:strand:- start:105 stop:626 length:522 start_codon:yes stop_codon:yes gene_type:complete